MKKFFALYPKVEVFDKDTTLYGRFIIKKISGHTKGSSVVFFNHDNNNYCFTGDEIYLKNNVTKNIGNGSVVNHKNNIDFIDLLKNGNYTLFIFHDSSYINIKQRFIRVFPAE